MQVPTQRGGTTRPGHGVVLADPPAPPLTAPVRNRYFYGKLLDVYHLELEQRYFLEQRRRLNRLTVGFGVVCGLDVTFGPDGKSVLVTPGVAIDGLGREIVVTETICISDPSQLTDDCGRPAGAATELSVTLCLSYRECDTEPTPVLVSDCDVRERCAAGAVRERYALLVHDGVPETPPYGDVTSVCHFLAERLSELEDPGSTAKTFANQVTRFQSAGSILQERRAAELGGVAARGGGYLTYNPVATRRPGTTPIEAPLFGCDPPADDCVVLATVTLAAGNTAATIDPHAYRRTVLSNDRLFEAVLCLARAVERCCGTKAAGPTIDVVDGDGQTGRSKQPLAKRVAVVVSEGGNPVPDATVRFEDTSASGGKFTPASARTDAEGKASSMWTLGSSTGPQTARVALSSTSYVDITATSEA